MTNGRPATAGGGPGQDDPGMNGDDLDPDVRRFIRGIGEAMAAQGDAAGIAWPERRARAERARAPWRQGGPQMLETRDLEAPTRHGRVRLRIHRPDRGELPALVYLHGGGWALFSIDTHDRVMREYADRVGCCVVGIDYALSPEHRFPVALEQVADVLDWLARSGPALGIDATSLAIGGDSAGANLGVAASLLRRDAGERPLRGMLLNYGAFVARCSEDACRRYGGPDYMLGCEEMTDYWRTYVRSDDDLRNPLVCPLLAELSGLPPAFLAIAECDILAEQGAQMAGRLQSAGVPAHSVVYRGASHSFIEAMSIAEVSNRAFSDASAWLTGVLRPGAMA
jgi:acetyl esterase